MTDISSLFSAALSLVSGNATFQYSPSNGKYYKVLTPSASYYNQKSLCSSYGTDYHLAVVLSQKDYDEVMRLVDGRNSLLIVVYYYYFRPLISSGRGLPSVLQTLLLIRV